MTEEKPHISPSQLNMFWRCPEQWRRRYCEKEIIPPGIALLVGSGYHVGAETNASQKIESHEDLPEADIVDASVAGFENRSAGDGYLLSEEERSIGSKKVLGSAKDTTARLAAAHAKLQAPDYQPVAVEHSSRIVFPNATHDLLAITDMRDDKDRVVDWKTAAKKPSKDAADKSIQLTVYAAAFQLETGRPPAELRLDTVTKTKTIGRHVHATHRTAEDFKVLIARVNATLAAMASGAFPPASPDNWFCSSKFCGFHSSCKFAMPER